LKKDVVQHGKGTSDQLIGTYKGNRSYYYCD